MTELKGVTNPIDSAGPAKQVLSNLFYGWGYNFYRKENQLRADDLLVRAKVGEMLAAARTHLAALERDWRRVHLPPPTREHPFPDPAAVARAQGMQRAQQQIEALELRVRTAGVPEMDRIHQRHREEATTLTQLVEADGTLVLAAKQLGEAVLAEQDAAALTDALPSLIAQSGIESGLAQRQQTLSALAG